MINVFNEIFELFVYLVYSRGGFIFYFVGDVFIVIFFVDCFEE